MKSLALLILVTLTFTTQAQTFTEVIKASAYDRTAEDRMGYAVDISGDYAIVGAYGDDFGEFDPNMGSAYIFEKTGIEDWAFVQKINNSDQDDYDRFGWSVAIDGDYAVVGAYGEDHDVDDDNSMAKAGSAYIFERDEFGSWNEVQKIVASDRDTSDEYGWTVDLSDNTIIVGAHKEDHDAIGGDFIFRSGSVYVYDRGDDGIWTETQKVVAWDRQADSGGGDEDLDIWHYQDIDYGDLFGCSIGLSGDYMIVGAHNGDYNVAGVSGISQAGAAYIFKRDAGVWAADQKVIATVRGGWDRYGYSVAIDSNVAVVGAKAEDHSEFEAAFLHNAGSAYIYTRDISGDWGAQKIDASDRDVGDHFGISAAIAGNYMVIGAEAQNFDEDVADELGNAGAAYLFEKNDDGTWDEIQKIDASDRDSLDLFGDAVAISEHTILIGAWQQDLDSASLLYTEDAGAAYFFSSLTCTEETFAQDLDICAGESIEVGLSVYTETGTYVDTLLNSDACDSIVTTNLLVSPIVESIEIVDLCFGETYEIGESVYEETGTYLDTLTSEMGCDSIVTTELSIAEDNLIEQSFNICFGETVIVGESVYSESGTYTDLFEFDDACDTTVVTTIDVVAEIDISINDSEFPMLISNEPEGGSISYQWIKCDPFEIIDGATEIDYTAIEDGAYAVIIEKEFCIDTSECYSIIGLGIENPVINDVNIYPNPSNGQITIELAESVENGEIILYNNLGAIVSRVYIENNAATFDFSGLSNGIYLVHIISDEKLSYAKIRINK
ncbi:MAG: hypothetical protein ACI8ZM_000216 [Crocinitomix sp.]|jgi:hypothetical protein